jgi:hypothetical protein
MIRRLACLTVAVVLASFAAAQPSPGAVDCRMLANMPGAPMSVEACERRMAAQAEMMSAMEAPAASVRETIQ